ncbi:hypothetical protein [Pseudonocardia sp. Ae706_Ps2]|uniref:hypothetical protein n=1 Tax=Pseudonocardia sp. Ae706_Ps2 TaxID=1885035 RepID=UPI00094E0BE9|nr:hypothetical protein [Pseudonocardia sp. Ae706_Ps2]
MESRSQRRKVARLAKRRGKQIDRVRLSGRQAAEDAVEHLSGRSGVARVVWTALTMQRCSITQTYWLTRDCCRSYHVGLGLPDGSAVIVEMTFPDDDTSELVLATHCGTGTYAQDVATVTAWLLPGLAD